MYSLTFLNLILFCLHNAPAFTITNGVSEHSKHLQNPVLIVHSSLSNTDLSYCRFFKKNEKLIKSI
jgi:hypothetical protein